MYFSMCRCKKNKGKMRIAAIIKSSNAPSKSRLLENIVLVTLNNKYVIRIVIKKFKKDAKISEYENILKIKNTLEVRIKTPTKKGATPIKKLLKKSVFSTCTLPILSVLPESSGVNSMPCVLTRRISAINKWDNSCITTPGKNNIDRRINEGFFRRVINKKIRNKDLKMNLEEIKIRVSSIVKKTMGFTFLLYNVYLKMLDGDRRIVPITVPDEFFNCTTVSVIPFG